ncbi:MAG: hypothetical protein LC754_07760 [Acidobacteria bacterium]|nr:hypothetical protein [Acidobacteriota bacterium]
MNFQELNGTSLAILLAGEDEDWSVLRGTIRQEGEVLLLDHSAGEQPFVIQPEWLNRIKPVPADLSDILMEADFFLPLSVGALPEGADPSNYIHTGLKLPE